MLASNTTRRACRRDFLAAVVRLCVAGVPVRPSGSRRLPRARACLRAHTARRAQAAPRAARCLPHASGPPPCGLPSGRLLLCLRAASLAAAAPSRRQTPDAPEGTQRDAKEAQAERRAQRASSVRSGTHPRDSRVPGARLCLAAPQPPASPPPPRPPRALGSLTDAQC